MDPPIRVLLADDHPLVRAGLRATVAGAADIALVGEATTGEEVRRLCEELAPDVVLLDLQMPGPPPTATVAYLHEHCPGTRVLVLTAHDGDAYVLGLLAAGVAGYVLKDEVPEALLHAIHAVAGGGAWFSQGVMAALARSVASREAGGPHLTPRERALLAALERGWDNARIAATLHLSEQTVRNYLSRLYAKLNVRSRAEAMAWLRDRPATDLPTGEPG
jgi:DNA-binding NarL/FixJ family response regulator